MHVQERGIAEEDPCPSTRVFSASNVVGRTRVECATIPSHSGRGSSRSDVALALQDIIRGHMRAEQEGLEEGVRHGDVSVTYRGHT